MNFFKKFIGFALAAATVCSFCGVVGCSNEAKLVFEKIDGKEEYAVVDIQTPYGIESPQDVTIPAEYKGLPVTKVVLTRDDYVRVAYLPSSVTEMEGKGWHEVCTLEELHVGSIESLLNMEYSNYEWGTTVVDTSWDLYVGDTLVTELDFSRDDLEYLGLSIGFGFAGCQSLERVDLTGTYITYLGGFEYCRNLKEVVNIPYSLTAVGSFRYCTSLEWVEFPLTITEDQIAEDAFIGCPSLNLPTI